MDFTASGDGLKPFLLMVLNPNLESLQGNRTHAPTSISFIIDIFIGGEPNPFYR